MTELNNIYRVGLLEVSNLKSYRRKEEREVDISFVGELHYLQQLMTPAALSVTEKVEDGCRTYASKLALKTCEDIDCSKGMFLFAKLFPEKNSPWFRFTSLCRHYTHRKSSGKRI